MSTNRPYDYCPRGCHLDADWSFTLLKEERHEEGMTFEVCIGEFCDFCGAEVRTFDPAAERDERRSVLIRACRFVLVGVAIGTALTLLANRVFQ